MYRRCWLSRLEKTTRRKTHLVLELARILFFLAQHLFLPGNVFGHVFLALGAKLLSVLGLHDVFGLPFGFVADRKKK